LSVAVTAALCLGSVAAWAAAPVLSLEWTDNFDGPALDSRWWWVNEQPDCWSLTVRPGFLRIMTLSASRAQNLLYQDAPQADDLSVQALGSWPHTDTYLRLRKLGSSYTDDRRDRPSCRMGR
jgi:hypothetical protein